MRKLLAGGALGLAAALVVLAAGAAGLLDTAELKLYDWRARRTADPSRLNRDIVLVEINDQTIRDFEPAFGRWPWPRVAYTLIFGFLERAPARVVALDIGLSEPDRREIDINGTRWTGTDSDAALAEAVQRSGNVVVLGDAVYAGAEGAQANQPAAWRDPGYRLDEATERRPILLPPYQALTDAAAAIGHNFLPLDEDGPARRMPPFIRVGDRAVPSLGLAAALVAGGFGPAEVRPDGDAIRIRDRRLPLAVTRLHGGEQRTMLVDYRAPTVLADGTRPYRTYEARHLMWAEHQLQNGEKPDLDPGLFRDAIVFVGATASGTHDVFQTPFGGSTMPGIQVHASMADSLLSNRFLRPAPAASRRAAVLLLAVVAGIVTVFLSYQLAVASAAVIAVAWTGATLLAFDRGVWLSLAQPVAAIGLTLFAGTAYRYFVEDREKRKVKKLFGRYVSRDVYAQLLAHPERAELGGARREMTVLFSDIRGFTAVTEKGEPEALVAQLNEYFTRMVDIVFRHHGTVDKFVGDMVMALFGAPMDDPDHAEHAVAAAVEMVRELGELNRSWAARGGAPLDIGIGVNSGEMIAGNIGSSAIMSYTVIGDNVNLGSRLESLNKDYKTRIIVSDATRVRLKGGYDVRALGEVIVKGKTRPVAIFEVRVPSPLPTLPEDAPL